MHKFKPLSLWNLNLIRRNQVSLATSNEASVSAEVQRIRIPARIKREPADLLKALASTVDSISPTAAEYKYVDDPYLIPFTANNRRLFALAKESGRKAAKFMTTKFAPLFAYEEDEPRIGVFRKNDREFHIDQAISKGEFSEEMLISCLKNGLTSKAIKIYDSGIELSLETKIHLLEYLAFHNCQDGTAEEFRERYYYSRSIDQTPQTEPVASCEWPDGKLSDLFRSVEPKTMRTYAAVICNLSKHGQHDEALKLYDEMQSKFAERELQKCDVTLYNHVLMSHCNIIKSQREMWEVALDFLKSMTKRKVAPTVETFNNLLEGLHRSRRIEDDSSRVWQVLREMKALNIDPSPVSFYYVLSQFQASDQLGSVMDFILHYLESGAVKIKDPRDFALFPRCMRIICEDLHDMNLAYRLHRVVQSPIYNTCFCSSEAHTVYYDYFVDLLAQYEGTEKFLDFLESVFPHIYTPRWIQMRTIIDSIELSGSYASVQRLYPALVASGLLKVSQVVQSLVFCMYGAKNVDEHTKRVLGDIAFDLKEKVDVYIEEANRFKLRNPITWKRTILDQLSSVCERAGQFERSKIISATSVVSPAFDQNIN